jgi:Domain of unknown function (DUF4168)
MHRATRVAARHATTALATALLMGAAVFPAMAQSSGPALGPAPGASMGASTGPTMGNTPASASGSAAPDLSDATIHKAGAAMRQVTVIRQGYMQRIQATTAPDQQAALRQQEDTASAKVVADHGLTVQQYNQVLRTAMANPDVKARLLREEAQAQ